MVVAGGAATVNPTPPSGSNGVYTVASAIARSRPSSPGAELPHVDSTCESGSVGCRYSRQSPVSNARPLPSAHVHTVYGAALAAPAGIEITADIAISANTTR